MPTQLELLKERLYGASGVGARNFKIFPGSDTKATPEEIAGEI